MYVFTYGTLKRDCSNHKYLRNSEFIETAELKGNFSMLTIINPTDDGLVKHFPCLVKTPQLKPSIIKGEIFKINEKTLVKLDQLESNGSLYQREEIEINGKTCIVYFFIQSLTGLFLGESEF